MFVSQERTASRKPFQKPNILRRKPNTTKRKPDKNRDSTSASPSPLAESDLGTSLLLMQAAKQIDGQSVHISQAPSYELINNNEVFDNQESASQTLDINGDSLTIYAHDAQIDDSDLSSAQSMLNVESFLNDGPKKKENTTTNCEEPCLEIAETEQNWCLDFGNDTKDLVTTNYYGESQLMMGIYIDKSSVTETENQPLVDSSLNESDNNITLQIEEPAQVNFGYTNTTVKFMCDVPNCKKTFCTETRLQKHKNDHNKPKTFPVLQCPVKNTDAEGVEIQCHRTFTVRNQLMKHLNDDHSPDDALYKCGTCGRRFYWAGGARLHQASGCARSYACAWAGCGRVFRHACRLREHARAHTGDRPYPCHYPECGWSFRSASKLMRHARRHTGERQHACGACGRAFLRREHLREHAARHHAPRAAGPASLPCSHAGCERTFSSTSSLYTHLKRIHKDEDAPPPPKKPRKAKKSSFVVQLSSPTPKTEVIDWTMEAVPVGIEASIPAESASIEMAGSPVPASGSDVAGEHLSVVGDGADGRSARTHCTWPLRTRDAPFVLEEPAQVEQSESCESNIYTVRSDLFLHGNLLINDDSEFIISRATAGAEGVGEGGAEGSLGLIDAHPTGDLTQEELMYADAVDESSFRVFLLNGEELA